MPREAYAPRSCIGVRMSAGEIAIFAMNKRTSAGAAGVGPPWIGNPSRLQDTANNLRGTPTAASRRPTVSPPWYGNRTRSTERFLFNEGVRIPRGADASRSWWSCGADICRRNCDLCDTRTLVYTSGGRELAVVPETAPAMAIGFRGVITLTTHDRMVPHGWLTPAAPGAALDGRTRIVANVRLRFAWAIRLTTTAGSRQPLLVHDAGPLKNNDIRGAHTHVFQERRLSARRGSATAPAMAIRFRRVITFGTHDRMVHHGWLTRIAPGAALGGRTRIVANVRLRFARATRLTATAGSRQPLLVHDVGPLKNSDIRSAQTQVLTEPRTVSPRWFGNLPRLQGAPNHVRRTTTAASRAAGVSPPWFGKRTCQYASAKSRESVNGAMTNSGAVAVANPRGADAPRSCVGVRMSAGEIAIFAMHKRTSAGAAGVSPPWD
jgi:hypothetical protein